MPIFGKKGCFFKRLQGLAPSTKSKMVAIFGLSIKNGVYSESYRVGYKKVITLVEVTRAGKFRATFFGFGSGRAFKKY